jgi:dihydroorotase
MQLPGIIDCHVHFREPGLEHKATIATEAAAARSGGVFTVCEMPNTNPGTNTVEALKFKVSKADAVRDICDVRFFFGATEMNHLDELRNIFTAEEHSALKRNCSGLKLYLDNSTGNMKASEEVTHRAFALCAELGIVLVAHCEHANTNDTAAACCPYSDPKSHSDRRPVKSEVESIREAIAIAEKHNTRLHIAHLSTAGGLALVVEAKGRGLPITCEVTPHHLLLSCDDYAVLGGRAKVNPPLRPIDNRGDLWAGVVSGAIDCISTDHAPHLLSEKDAEGVPPSGLPGVETVLPLMVSIALGHWPHPSDPQPPISKEFSMDHIRSLMFENPNKIFGLNADPAPKLTVSAEGIVTILGTNQKTKCGWTPYENWKVKGTISEIKA